MKNDEKLKVQRWVVMKVLEREGESLEREGQKVEENEGCLGQKGLKNP